MERSRLLASGTVLEIESLPPSWDAKISSSLSTATASAGEVESAGMIVSVDTSLSPGTHRGRTAHGSSSKDAQVGLAGAVATRGGGRRWSPRIAGVSRLSGP